MLTYLRLIKNRGLGFTTYDVQYIRSQIVRLYIHITYGLVLARLICLLQSFACLHELHFLHIVISSQMQYIINKKTEGGLSRPFVLIYSSLLVVAQDCEHECVLVGWSRQTRVQSVFTHVISKCEQELSCTQV